MAKVVIYEPGPIVVTETDEDVKLVVNETPVQVTVDEPIVKVVTSDVGIQGPAGPSGLTTFNTFHTWSIQGQINIAIGNLDYIPPLFVSTATGQTVKIVKAKHRLLSGGPATVKLQRNGVDLPGFTAILVTNVANVSDPADQTLAEGDELALVVTGVAGAPQNLSFTIVLEHSG